jgi:hypothetical protein
LIIDFGSDDDDAPADSSGGSDDEFSVPESAITSGRSPTSRFQEELTRICREAVGAGRVPQSFGAILEHLITKLTKASPRAGTGIGLGDFTTVFKPGLFTNAAFDQQPLILKDLPNLSPAVFERFNELYSPNPTLVLNEDFCDTHRPG